MGENDHTEKKRKIEYLEADPVFDNFLTRQDKLHVLKAKLSLLNLGDRLNLASLYITDCNARSKESFSNATVSTTPIRWEDEDPIRGIVLAEIFEIGIEVLELYLDENSPEIPKDEKLQNALQKLLTFMSNGQPQLFEKMDKESDWSVLVAQHLLSPLTVDSTYTVLAAPSLQEVQPKCPCSQHDALIGKVGDTSFGLRNGWHGSPDIIVNEDIPVSIISSDSSGDSSADQTIDDDIDIGASDDRSVPTIEIKAHPDFSGKDIMQIMSETIVFSFWQQKVKKLENTLIPGIGISGRSILLIFYDSCNDVLLTSRPLPLFDQNSLEISTILALWLTLNYRLFCTGVTERMKKYKADFFRRADDLMEQYKDQVEKPVHVQRKTQEDLFPFAKIGRQFKRSSVKNVKSLPFKREPKS